MTSRQTSSSSSRRPRDSTHNEMAVGSYRRMEEIGRGSFATVYKAARARSSNFVAIKSVDLHKLNKKLKENLYSEIHILKGLHHPHIVALIDCQETSAHIHLIMEFCELGDLSYFIKKRDTLSAHPTTADMIRKYPNPAIGGLNEVIVRHFLKQLASALQFLRAKNFIHRDVKPQNLLLDPSPQYYSSIRPEHIPYAAHERSLVPLVGLSTLPTLKLADFGFARSLPSTSLAETLCGSPLYMAPEILRYEKYDAKADLWSVGTVLYEMTVGKPPFRASNHVELLRRIERGEDRIKFPDEVCLSDSVKRLIRNLLKRNPIERIGFEDFFSNTVVKDEIPGIHEDDQPPPPPAAESSVSQTVAEGKRPEVPERPGQGTILQKLGSESPTAIARRTEQGMQRRSSGTPPRSVSGDLREKRASMDKQRELVKEASAAPRRPSVTSYATAPARQELHSPLAKTSAPSDEKRRSSALSGSPQQQAKSSRRESREIQDRAAQEVAFERDYVVVDKRNVEVNAFADELAASPRIGSGNRGALVRRATTQGPPQSLPNAGEGETRAMQVLSGRDAKHQRQGSYERRLRDAPSATSAISKAINMASGRLFSLGFSPPLSSGKTVASPPTYNPFPSYPTSTGSILMLQDGSKAPLPLSEDTKAVQAIEDSATRSNVVYGFAEIKFQQLIPAAPSTGHVALENNELSSEDVDLNIEATVSCAEEALVLYVKALSLLARAMDIAGAWWARKTRNEFGDETRPQSAPARPSQTTGVGVRVNNVVQWVRGRFNEVLEKAEFVRLKLIDAQRQLPPDHPSHPSNHPAASGSTVSAASADNITVTSGVTAEKLMYDYALEKSRSAAVNELVGENLSGCEIDYVTAIWLLEAILEDDEDSTRMRKSSNGTQGEQRSAEMSDTKAINGVEVEDRKIVLKLVQSIRTRHTALKRKIAMRSRRSSSTGPAPRNLSRSPSGSPSMATTSKVPTIATTPP